jgi:hypothetical protein
MLFPAKQNSVLAKKWTNIQFIHWKSYVFVEEKNFIAVLGVQAYHAWLVLGKFMT